MNEQKPQSQYIDFLVARGWEYTHTEEAKANLFAKGEPVYFFRHIPSKQMEYMETAMVHELRKAGWTESSLGCFQHPKLPKGWPWASLFSAVQAQLIWDREDATCRK